MWLLKFYSAWWSANDWTEIKYLEPASLSSLQGDPVGLWGLTVKIQPGSLHFHRCFHFLLAQSLKVSHRWEFEPPQVFPEHVHSTAYVHGLLDSQEYVEIFKASMDVLYPFFFLRFLVSLLLAQTVILHLMQAPT